MEKDNTFELEGQITNLNIPLKLHIYSKMKNTIIDSDEKLENYINDTKEIPSSERLENILNTIQSTNIDFNKEVLMLAFHTETTGSAKVEAPTPKLNTDGSISINMDGKAPMGVSYTHDMAYYGFAYKVSRQIPSVKFESITDGVTMTPSGEITNTGMFNKLEDLSQEDDDATVSVEMMKKLMGN